MFWLDGTKDYVSKDNWYYVVIASICLILIGLVPFFLCAYPWLNAYPRLNNKLQKITKVYDAFQCQCNTNPVACRFSAFYFLYRLGVLAIIAYAPSNDQRFLLLSCFFLIILIFHIWLQPYKNNFYNLVDGSMFINLIFISILSFYRLHAVTKGSAETVKSFIFQTICIYLPLLYIVLLVFWRRYLMWYEHEHKKSIKDLPKVLKILYKITEDHSNDDQEMRNHAEYQAINNNEDMMNKT